jgi:hypothetical protein
MIGALFKGGRSEFLHYTSSNLEYFRASLDTAEFHRPLFRQPIRGRSLVFLCVEVRSIGAGPKERLRD